MADWLAEERLTTDIWSQTTSESNQRDIAVDGSGNVHIVWLDDRDSGGGDYEVYYIKYSPATGWGLARRLTCPVVVGADPQGQPILESHDKAAPAIAADSAGNLFVSYENLSTHTPHILRFYPDTGAWDFLPMDLGSGGAPDANPGLAADLEDNIHAVWLGLADGHPQVFYRKFAAGVGWQAVEQVTSDGSDKLAPSLAVDGAGRLHVAWSDSRDSVGPAKYEIYASSRLGTDAWSAETRLTDAVDSDSLQPFLAADESGNCHLVWEDDRDGNFEVYYARYDSASSAWGASERLTSDDAESRSPRLALDADGDPHVVWQDGRALGGHGFGQFSLYYKTKTTDWGDDIRLALSGGRASIIADADSNLHLAFSARRESVTNPDVYYLRYDPSLAAEPTPRELVLLLDVSGSMGWRPDGTVVAFPWQSRLYQAGQALSSFLDRFSLRNPVDVRFGLATYPNAAADCPSAEMLVPDPGTTDLPRLDDAERLRVIRDVIPALTADGKTPLAEGLTLAGSLFSAMTYPQAVLLVSDGYHNCPERDFPPDVLVDYPASVFSLGIGTAHEVDLPLLEDIAAETGGEFRDATTMTTLSLMDWLKTIIQSMLGLEAECDPRGAIGPGERREHKVLVTRHDRALTFDLSWTHPGEGAIGFRILTPEGRVIDRVNAAGLPGVTHISRETYQIFDLSEEFLRTVHRQGTWTIQLRGAGTATAANEPEPYSYGVLAESSLKLVVERSRTSYRTGTPIGLRVSVREGKKKRLPASLSVTVDRPLDSVGNWLAANPVPASALASGGQTGSGGSGSGSGGAAVDDLSGLQLKARYLNGAGQRPYPGLRKTETVSMYDDGTHGDVKPGDGLYAGSFGGTTVPGTYVFRVAAEGRTSAGEPFRREKAFQARVAVDVEETATAVAVRDLGAGPKGTRDCEVTIVPRDALGNFLGPGYRRKISISVKSAKRLGPLRDLLDGRYAQRLRLPTRKPGLRLPTGKAVVLGREMPFGL